MQHSSKIAAELAAMAENADRDQATIAALEIDLAAARRISGNQQRTIEGLQGELRRERSGRGGWGGR